MNKNREDVLEELRESVTDLRNHPAYNSQPFPPSIDQEVVFEFIEKNPALEFNFVDDVITIRIGQVIDFKFELRFEPSLGEPWDLNNELEITGRPENTGNTRLKSFRFTQDALDYFIDLLSKNYTNETTEKLKELLKNNIWDDWYERFLVEQLLRSRRITNQWLLNASIHEVKKRLNTAVWLTIHEDDANNSISVVPDPGFGSSLTIQYDNESYKLFPNGNTKEVLGFDHIGETIEYLYSLLHSESTNGTTHRQSIYWKNEAESTNNLMDKFLDKDFRDLDEKCFIEILLKERNVSDKWFQKISQKDEGRSIKYYKENLRDKIFKLSRYPEIATIVILSIGLLGSIVIFITFIFGKYDPVMMYWSYIGPILAITHLIAVGIVAFLCFDDLTLDMRHDDIGPVPHQIGWFSVATACFPIGYPLGIITKIISTSLTERFEFELEGRSRERIVFYFKDLAGLIPIGRIWIPTFLFGTIGTAYWYYLPFIYQWVLS